MKIKRLKIKNFKCFENKEFEFNDDINIIVGDNESGKTTILEALEAGLNFQYRGKPLSMQLSTELFNKSCVEKYLNSKKSQDELPEILIEVFLDGNPSLKGSNNSKKEDTEGIFIRICFDPELSDSYKDFLESTEKITTVPIELYKIEWFSFAWNKITHHNKRISCIFIDPTRIHPVFGRVKYINNIINTALDKKSRSKLNLNYRQLKARFDEEKDVVSINDNLDIENEITDKSLKIIADIDTATSWESNLNLSVDEVPFSQIGKGEQNQIQIKLALQNKAKDVDILMIEEPENHLSHINLVKLINYIEKNNSGKQIFLSTHSSYVLNKLSIDKLCLISNDYIRLRDVDKKTVNTLRRLPGYDTLRVVLSQKPILVEGPSDELILKKIYKDKFGCLPEEHGIDIIVVRGIGFKSYINIVEPLSHSIRIVKDNDGNYEKNIKKWIEEYKGSDSILCFSPEENKMHSLEPSLVFCNSKNNSEIDGLAKVMLSKSTYKKYEKIESLEDKQGFLLDWFQTESSGKKKVDSAIRIFESDKKINFPEYLTNAIDFES